MSEHNCNDHIRINGHCRVCGDSDAGPEDTIVSDAVRRYTTQYGLPQPTTPLPQPKTYQELVERWEQKASDAVEKFRHQPLAQRDTELWGTYVAYSNAAAQLATVMKQQNA